MKNQITGVPSHQHALLAEGQLPELFGKRALFTPEDTLLENAPNRNKPEILKKFQLDKGLKEQNSHTAGRGKEETPGLQSELLKSLLCEQTDQE